MIRRSSSWVALACATLIASCGNDDGGRLAPYDSGPKEDADEPPPPPPDGGPMSETAACTAIEPKFSVIFNTILNKATCNRAGCHGNTYGGGLFLKTDRMSAYQALLDETYHVQGRGTFAKRVVPGKPLESFLYDKLVSRPTIGDEMPVGTRPLNRCQLDAIRIWIEMGAKNE